MNSPFFKKLARFHDAMTLRKAMEEAGASGDPLCEDAWQWSLSPLANGRHAEKFQQQLLNTLGPRLLTRQFQSQEVRISADVPEALAILLGWEQATNQKLVVQRDSLTGHLLIIGTTGAGKTTFLAWLIGQLLTQGIRVTFHDHKGEGRRLLQLIPDAMVFRPEQELLNPLEPVGPPEMYWTAFFAELGRAPNLHAETWTEGPAFLQRIALGLKPGQPFPSLRDLARLLLLAAAQERRPKLATLGHAIESLCAVLGKAALVRKGPMVESRYRLVVHEYQQLAPRIHRFLSAIRLLRKQMSTMSLGHGHNLREVFVSDEAALEFGSEFASVAGSSYVPVHTRIITQSRSFGSGVLAGAQMLSSLDDALKSNVAHVVCLRCPNPREAREAQQMLMLPDEEIPRIMTLPNGLSFVRSIGLSRTALASFPKIELGRYLSDEDVAHRLASEFAWLEQNTIFSPSRPDDISPLSYLEILGEERTEPAEEISTEEIRGQFFGEHRALLQEIEAYPAASITEHYHNLKWSAGRGNRVKDQLIQLSLVISQREKSSNGRPREILTLTKKGKMMLHENA